MACDLNRILGMVQKQLVLGITYSDASADIYMINEVMSYF
jgi:hypothetical protein